jgi:hypothetical protein
MDKSRMLLTAYFRPLLAELVCFRLWHIFGALMPPVFAFRFGRFAQGFLKGFVAIFLRELVTNEPLNPGPVASPSAKAKPAHFFTAEGLY